MKKRQWSIHRSSTSAPDAQYRWDRAYQHLLQWSVPSVPFIAHELPQQENNDEYRGLRPRFDTTTSTSADHRAAA